MLELYDDGFNAADLMGNEINQLNERLLNETDMGAAKDIVEQFLLGKITKLLTALPFDLAMGELMVSNGNLSIEKTSSLACLSLRQFERKCRERIGMTPKLYARIARFSKAYRLREAMPDRSWTDILH